MSLYGKCNFGDLETGRKCGCLRYRVTKSIRPDEDDLCKCKHYECFHEEIEPSLPFYPFLLTQNQIVQQNIGYEIPFNVDEMISRQTSLTNYGELNGGPTVLQNTRNRNKKPFCLYCLPYGNPAPKIPRKVTELSNYGLIKSTYFDVDSDDGIKNEVESLFPWLRTREWTFFRCTTTSNLRIANEPSNGWSVSELKRIAGVRKKIYLGSIDEPVQFSLN